MQKQITYILAGMVLVLTACADATKPAAEEEVKAVPVVTAGMPVNRSFNNTIIFTGTTQYQQKAVIRAGIAGYLHQKNWKPGDQVSKGLIYCTITSKEQQALKGLDQKGILKQFSSPIPVVSGTSGVITAVNFQNGDYVAEGDVLANITVQSSLVLLVNVPVDYLSKVHGGTACTVSMPDGSKMNTHLQSGLPTADAAVQTQSFIVPIAATRLPEGANLKVSVMLSGSETGLAVPVSAVQTDETQEHFWVFKLGKDNRAYKIDVQAGKITPDSLQQIKSDKLSVNDKIIIDGAFGLADSARVQAPPPPKGGAGPPTP